MIKNYKNYQCELTGSMIYVRKNGELVGAKEVNPLYAIERYNEMCNLVELKANQN
jgi:hypothetical protein